MSEVLLNALHSYTTKSYFTEDHMTRDSGGCIAVGQLCAWVLGVERYMYMYLICTCTLYVHVLCMYMYVHVPYTCTCMYMYSMYNVVTSGELIKYMEVCNLVHTAHLPIYVLLDILVFITVELSDHHTSCENINTSCST